tara:strand:+ start:581 stop:1051 length:471 start_codon:yes stop_codon:yes gene_type:complete
MKDSWTAEEVAEALGSSRRTVQHHIYLGRFGDVDKRGREYVLTKANLVEYLGEARANELILYPAAFVLSAHSKRGVPCSTWAAILMAKDLFNLMNATYWIDDLTAAGHGDPVGFAIDVVKFLQLRESTGDQDTLDSDPLYDRTPQILRHIVKSAKV